MLPHCPGSVRLIENLRAQYLAKHGEGKDTGNAHSERGTDAHGLAAYCILMGEDPRQEPNLAADDRDAVYCYVSFARSEVLDARARFGDDCEVVVEEPHHLPEVHPKFFGTNDLGIITPAWTIVADYKHGVGVLVEVERNPQLMQYAVGLLYKRPVWQNDAYRVELVVCQPRGFHPDGPIRSWWTTVGDLKQWLQDDWLRSARATEADNAVLNPGIWCHDTFCEARVNCPALRALVKRVAETTVEEIKNMEDWELGLFAQECAVAARTRKVVDEEVFVRLRQGRKVSGWKIVPKKADRVFRDKQEVEMTNDRGEKFKVVRTVEESAVDTFGSDAYAPRELRSPAQIERLDGGKDFVKRWAYKPEAGQTVAPDTDARKGEIVRDATETFASVLQNK